MVKIVALIRKKEGLSDAEFLDHWRNGHPAYVRDLSGITRYRQNPAIAHHTKWPFDGMAELWFPSVKAVAQAFSSPEADRLREHEEEFIGHLEWFIAEEVDVDLSTF